MFTWKRAVAVGLAVPVLAAGPAEANDHEPPVLTGGAFGATYGPFWSAPGWFGPGPGPGPRYPGFGPGNGWGYPGLGGGPFVGSPFGGYGYGYGRVPFPYYPWFWGPPGAAGSFWTNGLSLYGPPVPTYGPIPGVFSAGDAGKQFFRNPPPANGVFVGLGWPGYRSPSPRPYPPSVNVWPQAALVAPPPAPFTTVFPPPTDATCIRLAVRVPENGAILWIDKKETKLKGAERMYESPPLKAGEKYKYDLIAQWTENGESKAESRTVTATAGETLVIDFTRPGE
jgi:uncharacterized protein (TIGR03000 family)